MKNIIIPVDFSANATNAAVFAGNLAIFYSAEIWLYHSYEMPLITGEFPYPLYDINDLQEAALQKLEDLKINLLQQLRSNVIIHIKAETSILQDGLTKLCDAIKPDLVVIGLSGSNALTKMIVGSNTIKIIHELLYPILVIPPKAIFTPILKIGFACDYNQIEKNTPVALITKIVKDFNAAFYILNVDFNNKNFTENTIQESLLLKELFNELNPVYESIEAESVTEGISLFAAKENLNWIAVIPKKHTVIQKIFGHSHTKDLLYHTVVPILCVHQ